IESASTTTPVALATTRVAGATREITIGAFFLAIGFSTDNWSDQLSTPGAAEWRCHSIFRGEGAGGSAGRAEKGGGGRAGWRGAGAAAGAPGGGGRRWTQ